MSNTSNVDNYSIEMRSVCQILLKSIANKSNNPICNKFIFKMEKKHTQVSFSLTQFGYSRSTVYCSCIDYGIWQFSSDCHRKGLFTYIANTLELK